MKQPSKRRSQVAAARTLIGSAAYPMPRCVTARHQSCPDFHMTSGTPRSWLSRSGSRPCHCASTRTCWPGSSSAARVISPV